MMSTLNLNKNSFTVDTSIWEAINDCTLPDKKEEDWRYMKWGKLKNLLGSYRFFLFNACLGTSP